MNGQVKNSEKVLTAFFSMMLLVFILSACYTATGVVLPYFLKSYQVGLSQIGLLPSLQSAGETVILFLTTLFVWKNSPGKAVTVLYFGIAAAFLFLSLTKSFSACAAGFFLLGILNGLLNFFSTAYLAQMFPENRGRFLTLYFMAQAVGCMIAPLYPSSALSEGLNWWELYRQFGITFAVLAVFYSGVWFAAARKNEERTEAQAGGESASSALRLLFCRRDLRLVFLCLAIFAYMGHQVALGSWLPTYMQEELHFSSEISGRAVALFSAGMLLGRFLYTLLSKKIPAALYGIVGALSGGAALWIGLAVGSEAALLSMVCLAGACAGAVSPLLISLGCDWFPGDTTAISSLTGFSGAIGATLFSWLIGFLAQAVSFRLAISFTVINLFVSAAFILLALLWSRKKKEAVL